MIELEFECPTVSEANSSDHWSVKHRRKKVQKALVTAAWRKANAKFTLPCVVTLTRIGLRVMDDDNIRSCLKTVRDCISDLIIPGLAPGQADGDERITWHYSQEKGKIRKIRIVIN